MWQGRTNHKKILAFDCVEFDSLSNYGEKSRWKVFDFAIYCRI